MNMIKIKSLKKLIIFFIVLSISILLSFFKNNHLEFIFATSTLFIIFFISKLSYFSIFSFLLWFGYLQEYFASISLTLSTGRLKWDLSVPIYYHELYLCIISFYIIEILSFALTDVLKLEKKIYRIKVLDNIKIAYLYTTISFIFTVLAYPTIPTLSSLLLRDQGFISSSFIVPISMVLLATTIDYIEDSLFLKLMLIINLLWILLHGDRVIVFGFVIFLILKYINNFKTSDNKTIINIKKTFVVLSIIILITFLGIRIQYSRIGTLINFSNYKLIKNIIIQGTAADVTHGFNCATDMWKNGNKLGGYTYLYYLSNLLPKANIEYNPAYILMVRYNTLGGGLFFTEPMMNGGIMACYLYSLVFICILVGLFSKSSQYRGFLIIPFFILIFRFAWYASLAGLVKMFLYYIPFLYFVTNRIQRLIKTDKLNH